MVIAALVLLGAADARGARGITAVPGDEAPQVDIQLRASNGYTASINGDRGRVELAIAGRGGGASYSVDGVTSTRRLHAGLGRFGRIALRFKPKGRTYRVQPPKSCKGKPQIVQEGIFVGTIDFTGEDSYTKIDRRRVRASVATRAAWRCKREGSPVDDPSDRLEIPVLGVHTRNGGVFFGAFAIGREAEPQAAIFLAGMFERFGHVRVERVAFTVGKPGTFRIERGLSSAAVRPPRPFGGSATFTRNADGSTAWSGTLDTALPGAGRVSLIGPEFTADLIKPRSVSELLDLFGLSRRAVAGDSSWAPRSLL
jgi:hypothetical protein